MTTTNTQRAADEMRRLIFSGDLAAGSDHLETELAERFGMSRTPVREAALILEAHSVTVVEPGWRCGVDEAAALILQRRSARGSP